MLQSLKLLLILNVLIFLNQVECKIISRQKRTATYRNCPVGFGGINCKIECGLAFAENSKIIGGKEAEPYSSPSTVYLSINYVSEMDPESTLSFNCGGTLIDETTILTAAHCVEPRINLKQNDNDPDFFVNFASVDAYLAAHSIKDINPLKPPVVKVKSQNPIIHEAYDSKNYINDIAILKLDAKVTLTNKIQIACLPSSSLVLKPTSKAYAFGWGVTDPKNPRSVSNVLMQTYLSIYKETRCKNVEKSLSKNWKTQICAGDLRGKRDTCQGDSGGPLIGYFKINGKERNYLVGITSYGEGCAQNNKPGIYTKVSNYIDWLNKKVK